MLAAAAVPSGSAASAVALPAPAPAQVAVARVQGDRHARALLARALPVQALPGVPGRVPLQAPAVVPAAAAVPAEVLLPSRWLSRSLRVVAASAVRPPPPARR